VRDISSTGRFIVGQCSSSSPGSFAGYVTDYGVTPPVTTKLLGSTTTARAMAVSADGTVIVGGESPNVAGSTSGGRPGVWRWNSGTSTYDWTHLPDGPNSTGGIVYRTVDQFQINDDGTIILGTTFKYNDGTGQTESWLTRWTWNAGTSQWDRADLYNISQAPLTLSSWWTPLPGCGIPPRFFPTAMTDDGNTFVGILEYSTCGSFIRGGFIYTGGVMRDLNDYLVSQGVDLASAGFGTFTSGGLGLSHLGYAFDISDDGNTLVGAPSLDPDTPGSWLIELNRAGAGCIPAVIAAHPAATSNFTACTSSIVLNASAAGSPPLSVQWSKNGSDIFPGPSGNGSTYQMVAVNKQLRITAPLSPADAGSYVATASNSCGSAASSAGVVQVDPAVPVATNDTCATAEVVALGTNVLGAGQSPCGAWVEEPWSASCVTSAVKADRWFVFTPPISQEYRVETCGSNYDTALTVYADCAGTEMACNNDYNTGPSSGCSSNRSRIARIALNAGVPYYIRIAAPQSAFLSGTSVMNLSIAAAPPAAANDECWAATTAVIGANAFDTTEATHSLAVTCNSSLSRDVFFDYTPPARGRIRVATCPGTAWNTVLSVHSGACGGELACNDNANVTGCSTQSIIDNFRVDAGFTYQFRVAGNSTSAFGAGTLTLSFTCDADMNGDGTVDFNDFLEFLNLYNAGDLRVDFNGDGVIDFNDLLEYLNLYNAGC